ncbi:hypothetical protein SPRG_07689 [Saprolegnia parasitica CBS 223.65]|uniref:Uncharacterized protein n=1 Tax=Saprolegnia parasitica (strain CBS 223.65) TaxID=695850 RepID=A0A067CK94_SAPPC|nr:hypothetical protein SPRG_07689 [Saprolegnia parasitica CBS 223.65]KDO26976.1 hypothetical protein SPRG_07689 [Saprolegnia parasitica CBS 223.65]|eukprot:XP_012202357.1 hypothetical protein SPRG_07689 [Saprolegnia parasitica CBS 223.65]
MAEHVDLSTGIAWHAAEPSARKRQKLDADLSGAAFEFTYEKVQTAVNSVLQKANHACYLQVLDYFVERSAANPKLDFEQDHLVPLQPFPVAAIVAGTDASAASSAVWTDPLIRHLKRRFPFVVSVQRKYANGRMLLEFVATSIFHEIHQREREGQWLQSEMRRTTQQTATRRSARTEDFKPESDLPAIKWDTVAGILEQLSRAVTPIMQLADDVSIQADMLVLELRSQIEQRLDDCRNQPFHVVQSVFDSLVEDSSDRLASLKRSVGSDTFTERLLLQLHQELLLKYMARLETELAGAHVDGKRYLLRQHFLALTKETSLMAPVASGAPLSTLTPTVLLVFDQYESVPEDVFADFLHMWKDHGSALRLGCVLGLTSLSSPCYRCMPLRIATCLVLKPFVLEDSLKCFHDIIQTLLIAGECPVVCSGAVLTWLYIGYTKTHSIAVFLQSIRCLLYRHLNAAGAEALLCVLPLRKTHEYNHPWVAFASKTTLPMSVAAYMNDVDLGAMTPGIEDRSEAQEFVIERLLRVQSWKRVWQAIWSCLELTHKVVMKHRDHEVQMLARALDGTLSQSKALRAIEAFLLQAGVKLLWTVVHEWSTCLATYAMDLVENETNTLQEVVTRVDEVKQILTFMQEEMNDEENLRMLPQVRQDIVSLLVVDMVGFLSPPLPAACALGRLFYYDDVKGLEAMFEASHFEAIQAALSNPKAAVAKDLTGAKTKRRAITAMPQAWCHDMHVAYKFYVDTAGMLINVAEWLEAFDAALQATSTVDAKVVQVRFLRALSTLRYLGFVRKYGKSEDYVEKLVFI